MKRDTKLFVQDIIDCIDAIEEFSKGLTKEKLHSDKLRQSAVVRQLEIIGEAAKNIPNSFREKYPDIPWSKVAGTRDIIIHGYFKVDLNIVWDITKNDLPKLKKQILRVRKDMG